MVEEKEKLIEKTKGQIKGQIKESDLFIALGTRNYVKSLKANEESLRMQIDTARKFKKPFFVVIDRNLSKDDRQYIDEYFSKDNIISRMEVDIGNKASVAYIAKEIKMLIGELKNKEDFGVTIVTPYGDYE